MKKLAVVAITGALVIGTTMNAMAAENMASAEKYLVGYSVVDEVASARDMVKLANKVSFKDVNVLEGSQKVDFKKLVKVEDAATVKEVKADTSKVDTKKAGKYTVKYEVKIATAEKKEEIIKHNATVTVVTSKQAEDLIKKGETVVTTENKEIKDNTQLAEAVEDIEEVKKAEADQEKKEEKAEIGRAHV